MKKSFQLVVCIASFCCPVSLFSYVVPYISIRSQGTNFARELVGWQTQINLFDAQCLNGSFSITPEYTRTWDGFKIAEFLFCDALALDHDYTLGYSHCPQVLPTIRIQGTKVPGRYARAFMAENFYLPTDYSSKITFDPIIENYLIDFNFFLGLDNLLEGLYFRIHTPLCHTRWNLNFCENIINPGTQNYDPGYFNDTIIGAPSDPNAYGINRKTLLSSFTEYISGMTITGVPNIRFNALSSAVIPRTAVTKTRLAEITAALGINFWNDCDYHFGFNLRAAAPTGNKPQGDILFEPMIGNGHHWELGIGLTSHFCLWRADDDEQICQIYADAYGTHLCSTTQWRTFDLVSNPLSRYMLATRFTSHVNNLVAGTKSNRVTPTAQVAQEFTPVANITTIPVDVSATAQGEFVLKFTYNDRNFQFDIGYNFWGRMCETICPHLTCLSPSSPLCGMWGLKGDAFVYGFAGTSATEISSPAIALSATEGNATIFSGTNNYPEGSSVSGPQILWNQNPLIDTPQPATNIAGNNLYTRAIGDPEWSQVNTSTQPELITFSKFDIQQAQSMGMSHKLFVHFNYIFNQCSCMPVYTGVGGEIEYGIPDETFSCSSCQTNCCANKCASGTCSSFCPGGSCISGICTKSSCTSPSPIVPCDQPHCKTCALSQWGIWVKAGFSF